MPSELDRLRTAVDAASDSAEIRQLYNDLVARLGPAEAAQNWWAVFAARDASET